jgi:tetratricopeptide (TPR) repeat protein
LIDIPIELDKNNSHSWLVMGIELLELQKYTESLQCLEKALKQNSKNLDAVYYMAYVLKRLYRYDESIQLYQEVIKENPFSAFIWHEYGVIHALYLGNGNKSIQCLKKAVSLEPKTWIYSYWLSMVLNDSEKYSDALDVANNFLKFFPDNSAILYCKIHILGNLEKYKEQIETCDHFLIRQEDSTGIAYTKANTLANLKKFKESIVWYDNAWRDGEGFYGIENKRRALEAIKTGNVSDMPFTFHCDGKKFDFSVLCERKRKTK